MTTGEAYAVLGLDPARASADDVRARFRTLVRANHPDRAAPERVTQANEATRRLVEAYAVLRDPAREPVVPEDDLDAWVADAWREVEIPQRSPLERVAAALAILVLLFAFVRALLSP